MADERIASLKDYPHDFLSVKVASDYLQVSKRHIHHEIEKGALPARKVGGVYKILITDFQLYVGTTDAHPSMTRK
jgi:excisionase family DNA binding protein